MDERDEAAEPSAQAVADWLRANPDFLAHEPELLAELSLRHPLTGRAVSLLERQVDVMRERQRALEARLGAILGHARENDAIAARLHAFARELLFARDPAELPGRVVAGLRDGFAVPQVALRLWGLAPAWASLPEAAAVEEAARAEADGLAMPACGPAGALPSVAWFDDPDSVRSVARLPLRVGFAPTTFGMVVLGSADPGRFGPDLGTAFLEQLAEFASAALTRLTLDRRLAVG